MKNKVSAAMERLAAGKSVVCAVSGGADSVALCHCLCSLQKDLGITLSACHFNHGLRGDASDADEAFCRDFCENLGISLTTGRGNVTARMAETGESLEEAARNLRYDFFASQPGLVATAHTADDNAETVLLNLTRGTALKGLCGIPEQRDAMIRPLLSVTREEVLAYLKEHSLPHREDTTNAEDHCLRNRLRHHVLPLLKEENPGFLAGVHRMTQSLRQDEDLLQKQADTLDGAFVPALREAPTPLRRRAIRDLLSEVKKCSAAHILAVENLIFSDDPSARVTLPGITVFREYDRLVTAADFTPATFRPVTLPCPGSVTVEELNLTFHCREAGDPITIRPRKAGDTVALPGGRKTVKKLFIDRKIPAKDRECVPILERNGEIIAIWGVFGSTDTITAE